MRATVVLVLGLSLVGCARELIPVVPDGAATGGTILLPSDPTFEVVARVTTARDPLPVTNGSVAYADLERSLAQAVIRQVAPRHDSVLTVELVAADAEYISTRLSVSLVTRATVRTRLGNAYVAQTTVVCRDGAIMAPEAGAKVIWACMTRIGHDLGGWLADLPPP